MPDERAIEFERLRRSVRVTTALLRAIADSRKLLERFSKPFLETVNEQDSQKITSARGRRQRDAVFAAAKSALAPEYRAKRAVDESLESLDDLDPSIASNARDIKSNVLAQLEEMIARALQDANEGKPAESADQFTEKVKALTAEMDLRSQELGALHKACKTQLRQARLGRLTTTKNIVIASIVLVTAVAIGAVGFVVKVRKQSKEAEVAAHATGSTESPKTESASVRQEPAHTLAKTSPTATAPNIAPASAPAPASAASAPTSASASASASSAASVSASAPNAKADSKQPPKSPRDGQPSQSGAKIIDGTATLSSGQSPEARKKSIQALGEVIKEWNAENDAWEKAHKKNPKK